MTGTDCLDEDPAPAGAAPVRTGVDVQSIARFAAIPEPVAAGVQERAFTPAERAYCRETGHPPQHFAARWAAKEAFRKMVDDPGAVPLAAVAVERGPDGPTLALDERAATALSESLGTDAWDVAVSLSHDREADVAAAQVVATGGAPR